MGIRPADFWANTWTENQLLGESHSINNYLEWERTRYLATMLFNVNCTKRSQMITPDKLFPLPQDVYLEKGKPKSTKEDYEAFMEKLNKSKKNVQSVEGFDKK